MEYLWRPKGQALCNLRYTWARKRPKLKVPNVYFYLSLSEPDGLRLQVNIGNFDFEPLKHP